MKDKQKLLEQYNQLQKEMQQTARDLSGTQPKISKELRDTMGRSQQAEIGTRMEVTQNALQQGMGQYAILREAPVTRALNQLRDELQALQEEASAQQGNGAGGDKEDKSQIAMQQALNQADRVRREIEQLGRAAQDRRNGGQQGQGNQGQQPGQQQGKPGQQAGNQPGQQGKPGQQPGQGQQGGQQQAGNQQGQGQQGGQQQGGQQQAGSQSGQQSGGQQSGGQQSGGQQGGQQQGGQQSARGGGSPNGGGYGNNYGGAWDGRAGSWDDRWREGNNTGAAWDGKSQPVDPQTAYNDLMRDIGRLRATPTDDKDVNREIQDLTRRAQELDPKHWNNDAQLDSVIGSQLLSEVDQLELVLRRKLQDKDGSVRSATPRNTPAGYADAVAEYYKRLSKQ